MHVQTLAVCGRQCKNTTVFVVFIFNDTNQLNIMEEKSKLLSIGQSIDNH